MLVESRRPVGAWPLVFAFAFSMYLNFGLLMTASQVKRSFSTESRGKPRR